VLATKLWDRIHWGDSKQFRRALVAWLVFIPLNVLTVLACYWLLRLLEIRAHLAALTALAWLLGTTVLPYAQVPFQNNQVLLFVTLSYACVLARARTGKPLYGVLSGAAAGFALLVRATAAIHVLTIGLFLLLSLWVEKERKQAALRALASWAVGFLPLAILGRLFDFARYGSLWTTGQTVWLQHINSDPLFAGLPLLPQGFPFTNDASVGVVGVLFSPAKSVFIYDPLLLPCLIVAWIAWRDLGPYVRGLILLGLLNLALHVAMTSRLDFWHGDGAWGARYHVTSVDLLLIPLMALLVRAAWLRYAPARWGARAILTAGIAVQAAAVCLPFGVEFLEEVVQLQRPCAQEFWDSRLDFRLGNRVRNLSCLVTGSNLAGCPAAVIAATSHSSTVCLEDVQALQRDFHWAFYPFAPRAGPKTFAFELGTWSLSLILAIGATAFATVCYAASSARAAAAGADGVETALTGLKRRAVER
ncbi:MAG: hypothetical protein JOZ11_11930, partial [Alphaproteobacteria bacterium]|nr:hypothetical protein [Alphaproteobacteria bacterium]